MLGSSRGHLATLAMACVALTLATASPGGGQVVPAGSARTPAMREVPSAYIAQQLGVRLAPEQPDDLTVGTSITGTVTDPTKFVPFGLGDVQVGARVTVLRTAQERVRVEIDELDPTPRSRGLTLRVDATGRLSRLTP